MKQARAAVSGGNMAALHLRDAGSVQELLALASWQACTLQKVLYPVLTPLIALVPGAAPHCSWAG